MIYLSPQRLAAVCLFAAGLASTAASADSVPPNFVFIFCDNLGYGDIEPFGSEVNRTPNLIRMAREGRKFTDFYVPAGVCTPSRASFLTGCYPRRVNMHESDLMSADRWPMVNRKPPLADIPLCYGRRRPKACIPMKSPSPKSLSRWATLRFASVNGISAIRMLFLPTVQGFDEFVGIPYSEGMMEHWDDVCPPLPLMHNAKVIEAPVDCNTLTRRYTRSCHRIHPRSCDGAILFVSRRTRCQAAFPMRLRVSRSRGVPKVDHGATRSKRSIGRRGPSLMKSRNFVFPSEHS